VAAGVFLSFRPEDAAWAARVRDRLQRRLLMWKQNDLGRGVRFANALKTRAGEVEAVVLIIGKNWLAGVRNDPSDRVRIEIEAALERKIRVIPVLVDGASMPSVSALPESLKILARLQPIELSPGRFDSDVERLEGTLRDRPINLSGQRSIELPFPDLPRLRVTGVKRIAAPFEEKAARKPAAKRKTAKKPAAKKTAARKSGTKTAAPKGAGRKAAAKATARKSVAKKTARKGAAEKIPVKKTAAKKTAARKPAANKAARPTLEAQSAAGSYPRIAVNQHLSVDEMKHFARARRDEATPHANIPRAGSENAQPADPVDDAVECSVFGPAAAPPGKTILIQVFLHLANQGERASFLASTMDASAKLKGTKSLDLPIKRGARVEIAFSANGLQVDDPVQSVVWRGEPAYCQFLATLPAGTNGQSFFPVVRVSVDGKLIGPIKFRLTSDAAASQPISEPLGDKAKRYKYAFVSYASKDRKEVLKRVQILEILKTKFFQDILSLDPGDRWKKKLYENIDRCDLFLLFWSEAAKDSQWVLKEAEYAVARQQKNPQSEPDLVPVVLEQNVPPPPSLSAFHFNDRISYLVSLMP
jgi:TIR domain/Histone H1-like nucleoprotein HC2